MRQRFTAGLLSVALGAGLLSAGAPGAHASSKGRKNTALVLGALAAYGLLSGKTGTGLLAGAGAAYAYKRYRDARKSERRYGRYYGSRYRTRSTNGGFQFPAGYSGGGGQYQYGGDGGQYQYGGYPSQRDYSYDQGQYSRRGSQPYVSDTWGRRHYYDPRQGDGFNRYDGRRYDWQRHGYRGYASETDDNCPPSGSRGSKRGWRGHSVPPGHWRKGWD
jgi:hypothetical protein